MWNKLGFIILFLASCFIGQVSAERLVVIGDAYDLDGEQLLYREYHYYSDDLLDHRVVYKDPEGQEIAVKMINYRSGFVTPSFTQRSKKNSQLLSVIKKDNQLNLEFTGIKGEGKVKQLKEKSPLVIDAGFVHLIREYWDSLAEKNAMEFYFPAVTRLSLFKLKLKGADCSYSDEQDQCFRITSANWLINLLLDSIELGFDKNSKKLSRFRGLANLTDESGKGLKVDITYSYQ